MKIVFIVDDSNTNLIVAKNTLEGLYKTYAMASAERMFKLLEKIMPDLILLDVDMPEMDGFEAITKLKAEEKYKSTPVIFLTAKYDAESEKKGLAMGAVDFIKKPFSAPDLIKCIETHIETQKPEGSN